MNMVYEGIRQHGSMILVPSSAVETMGMGALPGYAALARSQEAARSSGESHAEPVSERAEQAAGAAASATPGPRRQG